MAERMGIRAWEIDDVPFEWYQRYGIVIDAENTAAERSQRKTSET